MNVFEVIKAVGEIVGMLVLVVAACKYIFGKAMKHEASVELVTATTRSSVEMVNAATKAAIDVFRAEIGGKIDAATASTNASIAGLKEKVEKLEHHHERASSSAEEDGERITRLEEKVAGLERLLPRKSTSTSSDRIPAQRSRSGRDPEDGQ